MPEPAVVEVGGEALVDVAPFGTKAVVLGLADVVAGAMGAEVEVVKVEAEVEVLPSVSRTLVEVLLSEAVWPSTIVVTAPFAAVYTPSRTFPLPPVSSLKSPNQNN